MEEIRQRESPEIDSFSLFQTINIRDEELMQEKGESEGFDENESAEIEEPEQNSASRGLNSFIHLFKF